MSEIGASARYSSFTMCEPRQIYLPLSRVRAIVLATDCCQEKPDSNLGLLARHKTKSDFARGARIIHRKDRASQREDIAHPGKAVALRHLSAFVATESSLRENSSRRTQPLFALWLTQARNLSAVVFPHSVRSKDITKQRPTNHPHYGYPIWQLH